MSKTLTRKKEIELAQQLTEIHFGKQVSAKKLVGELDLNFRLDDKNGSYLLKISQPHADQDFQDFQLSLMKHVAATAPGISAPQIIENQKGEASTVFIEDDGSIRQVRMLTWIEGRLWSSVLPKTDLLRSSLGRQSGALATAFQNFDHPYAHRDFEWDLAQSAWTKDYLHLFHDDLKELVTYFQDRFDRIQAVYQQQRKSVIHNDANDNNVIVSEDLASPQVVSIIDYGDAIYTQTINDLAVTLAYAIMELPDPLQAALPLIRGYHQKFPLKGEELQILYILVGMRLVISVTKSAINRQAEPENEYLQVSEKPAWELLKKWFTVNEQFAYYSFRKACNFDPHPDEKEFAEWAEKKELKINSLFPTLNLDSVKAIDMGIGSTLLGHTTEFGNNDQLSQRLEKIQKKSPNDILGGGYLETRPIYSTEAYKKEGNSGPEYRTVHLGVDFWVEAGTPIHSLLPGKVLAIHNNDNDKDYGPTVILEHELTAGICFYSLYGHLSRSSLDILKPGNNVQTNDLIGYVGDQTENGNWVPHLHFQLMLDLLGNSNDFPGVCSPNEVEIWQSICPDPNLLFKLDELSASDSTADNDLLEFRHAHLGKGLSLSYNGPLKILRGNGVYLINADGRRYLDTVNNVAHVGHEHPRVVEAGREQMAVLNTNTRYLHPMINEFAGRLLNTFPEELSVVHFVNSGSEANELAIRMAKTFTKEADFIAVEIGYHGNTNANIGISSYKFDGKGGTGAPEHTHIVPLPDSFRGRYEGENLGLRYASHVKEQIDNIQRKGRNVAGFICESIISCGGQIELPKDYLREAYASVRAAGGICIADEVQVGCGRVGSHFWAFELQEVVPDIVTVGKPIGNGHPLAAVICTPEVAEAFANGMEYFNTFGGNPVSAAIGNEVLSVVEGEKLQENALIVGTYLKSQLNDLRKAFPVIADVRGQGLFLGFELCTVDKTPLPKQADYLINRMKELGVLMSTDGPDQNVLKIKPPMVFSKENADELILRLSSVLHEDFMQL